MVGVGEDDAGIQVNLEVPGRDSFDCSVSADGHEYRRFDHAVRGMKQPGARARIGADGLDFEAECGHLVLFSRTGALPISFTFRRLPLKISVLVTIEINHAGCLFAFTTRS